ncbi:hypothetical protein dsat_2039 [Alkalidesulfovibrio alkalitolerans DSM 16529]|jgi:hypothetical protein|uniref:Uncharacterized protein n=1 Tax=Alkalidesulfovibrio alkalitolerans DSM 16529 TaxID=1121439 RepID=S7UTP3_9BACT|nr:hypothetical protein [Alkalidesulfovibrio alkalitolerans]EPR35698.1 hypothetical protein dsat_2039 [Alkalidesulfovibrio alkalitolerans DSM 16529]
MEQEMYEEDLIELIENVLMPLEKYFATFMDIGVDDQEPRRVFVDDIGKAGLALTNHAQDEIRSALELLYQKVGRVRVRRAGYGNRMGIRPRKIMDVDLVSGGAQEGWAKH